MTTAARDVVRAAPLPAFACPRCHGTLDRTSDAYRCTPCAAMYPVVLGIPDFRVFPDPWIDFDEDRDKARRLSALVEDRSFEDAVRAYWDITPATPRPQAEKFIAHVLGAERRSGEWLDSLDSLEALPQPGCWLDIGCGTADLIAAGIRRGITVVGVDIALRWLVVARRRDVLAGRAAQLVCANGEHLPFAPGAFARVVSLGTLEHCNDADGVVSEARRVLVTGGELRVCIVNRYSVLREPHVGVWGVGFVPRRWADRYVRWRNGQRYLHHRPLSVRETARGFRRAGFRGVRVRAAALLASDRSRLGGAAWAAPLYERLRAAPFTGSLIRWIAPLLDARGVAA